MKNNKLENSSPKTKSLQQLMNDAAQIEGNSSQSAENAQRNIEEYLFSNLKKVHLQEIDRQHVVLIGHLCNLHKVKMGSRSGSPSKEDKALLKITLEKLQEYTVKHFNDEVNYMAYIGYPDLDKHKKIHDEFVVQYLKVRSGIEDGNS
jgi:hemerythrin